MLMLRQNITLAVRMWACSGIEIPACSVALLNTERAVRILVIEDDPTLAEYVRKGLDELGFTVDIAADGKDGLLLATSETYDAIVVDRMLPQVDGLTVVRTLRVTNKTVPVLFLSALGEVDDRVQGLEAGGDDYLTKPFAFSELKARVEALIRRSTASDTPVTELEVDDLKMSLLGRTVSRNGNNIDLQPREFRLLEYLMRHAGQVVTRTMLLENVWDYYFDPQTNVIDVHISRLRSKIDKGFDHTLLTTVRGAGYRLG
jgi:two-component system OmpR family response regulator